MRDFFTARIRCLRLNWIWPLALLALPGCALSAGGIAPPLTSNLDPGPEPSGVVFCQIEKPESRHCHADEQEIADLVDAGFRLAAGAEALIVKATGTDSPVRLDSSSRSAAVWTRRRSATTRSPASTRTTSPGTTSAAAISTAVPSRSTLAVGALRVRKAAMAPLARASLSVSTTATVRITARIVSASTTTLWFLWR